MLYFALLAVVVALTSCGYLLEITSTDLSSATTAVKVTYIGAPFIGVLWFLFSRDYANLPPLATWIRVALFAICAIITMSVLMYPYFHIYYSNLGFNTPLTANVYQNCLKITPGLLYYPNFVLQFGACVAAAIILFRSFIKEKARKAEAIFIIAILLPLASQAANLFNLVPGRWNSLPTALTISVLLLSWYLESFYRARWQSTGRNMIVQNMRDGYLLVDTEGRVLDSNNMAQRFFSELSTEGIGFDIKLIKNFPTEILQDYESREFEHIVDGSTLRLKMTAASLNAEGVKTGTYLVIYDITEIDAMVQELRRFARHDELTGLHNRATFFRESTKSFNLLKRQKGMDGSALMMDIDHFKNINDTYGHASGDEVLIKIGNILNERLRNTDFSGRYGGEELCVWLPGTDCTGAIKVAEEIRHILECIEFQHKDQVFRVTISIGVASILETNPKDFNELVRFADSALYKAKSDGRNQVKFY